jgi:hypothetical protein
MILVNVEWCFLSGPLCDEILLQQAWCYVKKIQKLPEENIGNGNQMCDINYLPVESDA